MNTNEPVEPGVGVAKWRRFACAVSLSARAHWGVLLGVFLAAACGSLGGDVQLCGEIPADGCPVGRGGTCDDIECAALYDCVEGEWTRTETCPQNSSSGGGGGGSGGATEAGGGMGGCEIVAIDHSGEKTGCEPDLQSPDCPAVAAETCAKSACLTDCTDFFLCTPDGWATVAYCSDEAELVIR